MKNGVPRTRGRHSRDGGGQHQFAGMISTTDGHGCTRIWESEFYELSRINLSEFGFTPISTIRVSLFFIRVNLCSSRG